MEQKKEKSQLICIQEPLKKMAGEVLERIKEKALDINWSDSTDRTIENLVENEILEYTKDKWGKNIPYSLFESIWDALDWDEIESIRTEYAQMEKEWEKESSSMYWNYGMRDSDFY